MTSTRTEEKATSSKSIKSLPFEITKEQRDATLLINHLLCIPFVDKIIIFNTDKGTTKELKCKGATKLIHLPTVGFASYSYSSNGSTGVIAVWHVNNDDVELHGTRVIDWGQYKYSRDYKNMVASPDGRYLATSICDRVHNPSEGTVEIFLFDCVRLGNVFLKDPGIIYYSRYFELVFTQPRQLALTHHCGWFSIYNLDIKYTSEDGNYTVGLEEVLWRRKTGWDNFDFYPSPNGKYFLLHFHIPLVVAFNGEHEYDVLALLDAHNPSSKWKGHFSYNYAKKPDAEILRTQWMNDKIVVAVRYLANEKKHRPRMIETIEIYDPESRQKISCDVTHVGLSNWFRITDKGELFVLRDNGEYQCLKLPEASVTQCLSQHPEKNETVFTKVLQNTPGVNTFSRDLCFLVQDYAREPMQSMFFQPRKAEPTGLTVSEARTMLNMRIDKLQQQIDTTNKMLSTKKELKLSASEELQRIALTQQQFDLSLLQTVN